MDRSFSAFRASGYHGVWQNGSATVGKEGRKEGHQMVTKVEQSLNVNKDGTKSEFLN